MFPWIKTFVSLPYIHQTSLFLLCYSKVEQCMDVIEVTEVFIFF